MLSHVTFAGWDRHTDLTELQAWLEDCRQQTIEIAVLYSMSRSPCDEDRYPDPIKAMDILRAAKASGQRTAVHFCGRVARDLLGGGPTPAPTSYTEQATQSAIIRLADRIQVNVDESFWPAGSEKYRRALDLARAFGRPIIVQTRDVMGWPSTEHFGPGSDRMVQYLFDRSAGQGKSLLATPGDGEPQAYPTPLPRRIVGYAGGLGPDNVGEFLSRIYVPRGLDERYWIDMETKIRERFSSAKPRPDEPPIASYVSLTKCQRVMNAVGRWLEGAS